MLRQSPERTFILAATSERGREGKEKKRKEEGRSEGTVALYKISRIYFNIVFTQ